MAKKPVGYYSKGNVKSQNAVRKVEAKKSLTTLKGIAGIVGGAVLEGIGGPKARGAKGVVRLGKKVLSGKNLDAAIIRANASARSTKPVRNIKGLRTTTGQGKTRITKGDVYQAVKSMSESPNKGSGNISSVGTIRRVQGKPGVRLTTRTSGGRGTASRAQGPAKEPSFTARISKRAEGPTNKVTGKKTVSKGRVVRDVKVTKFEKPPVVSRTVTGQRIPFKSTNTEKVTVSRPRKLSTNRNGSAITIRKTEPRKASDIRAARDKARRDRLRNALTPRVNPARPKSQPKRGVDRSSKDHNVEGPDTRQGITIRGKFYADGNPGIAARGNLRQGTIESRLSNRAEKPTYGNSRRGEQGVPDSEADKLVNRSLRNIESSKAAAKDTIKPGQRTKVTQAIRKGSDVEIKRAVRNMRKVLKERALKEAGSRTQLTKAELARIEKQVLTSDFAKLMRKQGK